MAAISKEAIVLFAHGARDAGWAAPFQRMAARLRDVSPGTVVELAFLEFMQPDLARVVSQLAAAGVLRITVVPVFLAQGGHLKEDLPRLIAGIRLAHPQVALDVTSAIGDSEALTDAIADWALAQHRAILPG